MRSCVDRAAAGELDGLAVEAQVGELQAVVGVGVGELGGELEVRLVPGGGRRASAPRARTSVNGSAVSVSCGGRALGVAGELHAADALAARPQAAVDADQSRPGGDAFQVAAEGDVAAHGRRARAGEPQRQAARLRGDGAAGELTALASRSDASARVPAEVAAGFDARLDQLGLPPTRVRKSRTLSWD